ncbi:meiotic recombination protein SPO11 [Patella vulgata]|uniref:meiotic recombination protein SPO11 n=1 Tax=Patella vulgata TaxID=6465 RepID=UPI0021805C0E|nr:meiotic recombination protein SPO11 [Patella vulgata]
MNLSFSSPILYEHLTFLHRSLRQNWLSKQQEINICAEDDKSESSKKQDLLKRIETLVNDLVHSLSNGVSPVLSYVSYKDWDSVSYTEGGILVPSAKKKMAYIRYDNEKSLKKFGLIVKVLSIIYKLLQENRYCTKRDLYYQDPESFGKQTTLDGVVDIIAAILNVPRWELNVLATSKGLVSGDLQFYNEDGHHIDCRGSKGGISIPAHRKDMNNIYTDAKFILIVEKDATFQKLLGENFCEKYAPCILITAKGFPDLGTRLLLKLLWNQFQLPVFSLVDCDPHGFEIMAVYTFGSKAQACENQHLAVPTIKWLGILPSELSGSHIPEATLIPLTQRDVEKASELLRRPYVNSNWRLREQVNQGEILSFNKISFP